MKRGGWLKRKTPFKRAVTPLKSLRTRVKTKNKEQSISQLKKRADAVFSIWIRNRDSGICFTCGVQKPVAQMQNGHYVSRAHNSLRYDERNCHCQCVSCNVFRHGNMDTYALRLQEKYGPTILQDLDREKKKIKQLTKEELHAIINQYA